MYSTTELTALRAMTLKRQLGGIRVVGIEMETDAAPSTKTLNQFSIRKQPNGKRRGLGDMIIISKVTDAA
ncbi:MAG: hypothetical protein ACLSA6_05770 [Holdemania massiliensis]